MIQLNFNKSFGILEVTYIGEISIDDLIDYGEQLANNFSLPRKLLTLTDARNATYTFQPSETARMIKELENHLTLYEYMKAAFIQEKPRETALSVIIEKKVSVSNYYHRIFYTRETAIDWLLSREF